MAAGYDGTIRIDTSIESKGFNAGIKSMMASLKGFAAAIGIAFSIATVLAFGQTAVAAASDLASALMGLQSVLDGQGRSFQTAQKFIESYTKDGLIPATNAIKSYQLLALRGYSDDQIAQTLTALKDSAAFGRRAGLSMGEAVQTASEGLKNENSILVDNAGVTKNVAKMWDDYAKSIGTTANNLTQAQKIQAEVNGILEESKYQVGDAAKLIGGYAGQVAALGTSFYNFKVAVGNTIIPALTQIIPIARTVTDQLTILFNTLAQFSQAFFGVNASVAATEAAQAAADAQGELAESTEAAEKAARGSLAAFDELNVLQKEQEKPTDATGPKAPVLIEPIVPEEIDPKILAQVESFRTKIQEIFGPLIVWGKTELLPQFFDLLAAGGNVLAVALDALRPLGIWLWENFLKPMGEWTGGAILDILKWLTDRLNDISKWINDNPAAFQRIIALIVAFAAGFGLVVGAIAIWTALAPIATAVTGAFGAAVAFLTSPIGLVILAIVALIAIIYLLVTNWDWIKQKAAAVWTTIQQLWALAGVWFERNVVNPIKGAFRSMLDWLGGAWDTAFNGVVGFVKGHVNAIIDLINGMIAAIAAGVNAVIGGMNSLQVTIPDWVPVYGGSSWGLNIPLVSIPQIPRLANGGVLPANAARLAIVGDNRTQREIVTPEDLMRQIVREELGNRQEEITVRFEGTLAQFVRELRPVIERENRRIGGNLITGGSTA